MRPGVRLCACLADNAATPWWIYLTYGVIGGLGMGTTYTTTIACCQKWFPDKRGLITGCIVSALGLAESFSPTSPRP